LFTLIAIDRPTRPYDVARTTEQQVMTLAAKLFAILSVIGHPLISVFHEIPVN
jgi:hypothetical protein